MARRKKSPVGYWTENCFTCESFVETRLLHDGVDDGSVTFVCGISNEHVTPHKIDGCKRYSYGEHTRNYREVESEKSNEKDT